MVIRLSNTTAKKLIYFQLFFVLIKEALISMFHFPSFISYITDGAMILLFFCTYKKYGFVIKQTKLKSIKTIIILFTIEVCISSLLNMTNPITFIWAARNTYRVFILFFSCIVALDIRDVDDIFNKLQIMFWINTGLCSYQFVVLRLERDNLGGIFGVDLGSNTYMNAYLCIMIAYVLVWYTYKKISVIKMTAVLLVSLAIAALAEMKFFFVEFVIIVVLNYLLSKFSFRKLFTIIGSIAVLSVGLYLLKMYFADQYIFVTDVDQFWKYAVGFNNDASYMKIGRLSAFSYIDTQFFNNSVFYKVLGMGFGHVETSKFPLFNSSFAKMYSYTDYHNYVHTILYLETGYTGLILFVLFFVAIFIQCFKYKKKLIKYDNYVVLTMLMSILSILLLIYNITLRSDAGFIMYLMLALSSVTMKSLNEPKCIRQ